MSTTPSLLALLAVLTLAMLAGCKTGEADDEPAPVAQEGTPEGEAPGRRPQAGDDVQQQKLEVLVQGFLDNARAALAEGNLEAAHEALSHAFEIDPSNPEVQTLLESVSIRMGQREGTVGAIARDAEDLNRVRRAQASLEIERKLAEAERMRAVGNLDGAIRSLEDALLVLRWNPYGVEESGVTEQGLRDRLAALQQERGVQAGEERVAQEQRALAEQQEREIQERRLHQNRIDTFLKRANEAFYAERYKEAETFVDQILALDPNHAEARELKQVAADARNAAAEREYKTAFREHWREVFDDLEYDDLPQTELMQYPSDVEWQRIEKRGPIQFSVVHDALPPEDQRVWELLANTPIELNFESTSLEDAVEYFRIVTGANFIIDPVVKDSSGDISIDLKLGPLPAQKTLDLMMEVAGAEIGYRVKDGVVYVISLTEAAGGQVLEFYDVRDLTQKISSFPSKDFNLQPSGAFEDFEEEEFEPAPIVVEGEDLVTLIQNNIDRDSWTDDAENNTISYISGALVVHQVPETHRKIRKLLDDLRQNSGTLINIETRFLQLEDRFLQDIGVDFRGLDGQNGATVADPVPNVVLDDFGVPGAGGVGSAGFPQGIGTSNDAGAFFTEGGDIDLRGRLENLYDLSLGDQDFQGSGGLALAFTYLDDTQLEAILRAVEKSRMAELIHAQNLTVFNGQRANILVQDHVTYVKDFEVEIAQGAVIADPVVDVITDGTILDVRPVVSSDRRFVTMEVRPTVSNLLEPIPTFRTSLAVGNDVELQLPELEIQRIRTTVTIPDGWTLMLGGLKTIVETRLETGLPFFSDIPIVSFFLGRKGTEQSKKKLMILVRAKILIPEEREPSTSP